MGIQPSDDFKVAEEFLKKKFSEHSSLDLVNSRLKALQPRNGWSLINELIQNAVDIGAIKIKFTLLKNGNLKVQHDAKSLLDSESIQGLCGVAESSKGLDTVGFMGIGFKFFIKFFETVEISDANTSFRISYPKSMSHWEDKIESLYSPVWVNDGEVPDNGYTTSFYFQDIIENEESKISEIFLDIDLKRFGLFIKKGLKNIIFENFNEDEEIEITGDTDNQFENIIVMKTDDKTKNLLILEKSIIASKKGKDFVVNNRSVDKKEAEDVDLKRDISIVIEVIKKNDLWMPKPPNQGMLYCLVPLNESKFPFKLGLDADWFMNPERTTLDLEADALEWHNEMVSQTLPGLIKEYLELIDDNLEAKDMNKAMDIFPKHNIPIDAQFSFLENEVFRENIIEELRTSKFLKGIDGEIKYTNQIKNISSIPGGEVKKFYTKNGWVSQKTSRKLDEETYQKFLECLDVAVIDRKFIPSNTINYLSELEILKFPIPNDFNIEKIRELWDPNKPSNYLHILDMLSNMCIDLDDINLEVVPTVTNEWTNLFDPNLIFESLPLENNEKELFNHLLELNSDFGNLIEIHDKLKQGIKVAEASTSGQWDSSGNTWKECEIIGDKGFYMRSQKIKDIISNIDKKTISKKKLIEPIFRYAVRTNSPEVVKFLQTGDGIKEAKECLMPPPYSNVNLITKNNNRKIGKSLSNIINQSNHDKNFVKFLKKLGLIEFIPIEDKKISDDTKLILSETGIQVGKDTHKSSGANEEQKKKNSWTIHDWKWPIDFEEFTEESISNYLSNPTLELRNIMKGAGKKRSISYWFANKERHGNSQRDTTWIKELKSKVWVMCSDNEIRVPSGSPIEGSHTNESFFAIMDEDNIDFYTNSIGIKFESNLDDLSEEECMKLWQIRQVRRPQLFVKKLNSWSVDYKEKIDMALETIWPTKGDVFDSTKLKNFVKKRVNPKGGYIGHTDFLGEKILESLEKIGYEFPEKEEEEQINNCVNELVKKLADGENNLMIAENLRNCWDLIIERNFKLGDQLFLNHDMQIVNLKDGPFYIHPLQNDQRFEKNKISLYDKQFPNKLSIIREICDSSNDIILIDDAINAKADISLIEISKRLSRIANSMGLEFELFISEKDYQWTYNDKEIKLNIVIKSEDNEIKIYLVKEVQEWNEDLCKFLVRQKNDSESLEILSPLMELVRNLQLPDNFFEPMYSKFCDQFELNKIEMSDISEMNINDENIDGEREIPIKRMPPKLVIAEKKVGKLQHEGTEIKITKSNKKSNFKQMNVTAVESDSVIQNEKTSHFTTKEIGDRGEEIVEEYLRNKGWKVSKSNNDTVNLPGYDLLAVKDGEVTRYIEVKSKKGLWKDSPILMSHQQGLRFYDTIFKSNNGGDKTEFWLIVVEKILNEEGDAFSDENPNLHQINLTLQKPYYLFNYTQWITRNIPDEDF